MEPTVRSKARFKVTEFVTRQTKRLYDKTNNLSYSSTSEDETESKPVSETVSEEERDINNDEYVSGIDNAPSFLSDDKHPDAECYYWCLSGEGS